MRRKIFPNGSLEIHQVVKSYEEGSYSCEAKNRQGQSSKASTQLQVMGKLRMSGRNSDWLPDYWITGLVD